MRATSGTQWGANELCETRASTSETCRLEAVLWREGDLALRVVVPGGGSRRAGQPRSVRVRAHRVLDSRLVLGELGPGPLEGLRAGRNDPLCDLWGPEASLILDGPLPDPSRFFMDFSFLVRETLEAGESAMELLPASATPAQWLAHVGRPPVELVRGPRTLVDGAAMLAAAQGVPAHVRSGTSAPSDAPWVLRFGASWALCEEVICG